MVRIGPGFGDWLRHTRHAQRLTVRALATAAGLSPGTISPIESRRYAAPALSVLQGLSAALRVPLLAVGIVGGAFDANLSTFVRERFWDDVTIDLRRDVHDTWYARVGGHYLRAVRTHATTSSLAVAAQWWSDTWGLPITPSEWHTLEESGILPESWARHVGLRLLDRLPGSWLWSLLVAAGAHLDDVPHDLIMMTFLMGRLHQRSAEGLGVTADYQALMRACPHPKDQDDARIAHFIEWGRSYRPDSPGWFIPSAYPKPIAPFPSDAQTPSSEWTAREQQLVAAYRLLTPQNQAAIEQIVFALAGWAAD